MTKNDRYDVSDLIEAQYQPGSRGRVLRNLQEITGKRMMDEAEAREQKRALQDIFKSRRTSGWCNREWIIITVRWKRYLQAWSRRL
ncbi:hypothetical protein KN63_02755 [Smithella sp. F21]|jgi:hypothetical protein|nr:hypothetical protein KN63_02755 [Smithella sp. F21]